MIGPTKRGRKLAEINDGRISLTICLVFASITPTQKKKKKEKMPVRFIIQNEQFTFRKRGATLSSFVIGTFEEMLNQGSLDRLLSSGCYIVF